MILLDDLLQAGGQLYQVGTAQQFGDIAYDSRLTRPGELFLALRTPRADGSDYIADALAAGATGIICAQPPRRVEVTPATTIILAENPEELIQRWAVARLQRSAPTVVAVTGSVGKTSAKHAIATLLAGLAPTFESRQSFNSLFGLPIALAHLQPDQRFAVLEYGTARTGEIAHLAALFPPQVGVVTTIGAAHLDAFGTLEGVAHEKGALVAALPPASQGGWAILNSDDPRVAALDSLAAANGTAVLTFGQQPGCLLQASRVRIGPAGTQVRLRWQGAAHVAARADEVEATVPLLGAPAVGAALAAVSVALVCGQTLAEAAARLAHIAPLPGRLRLLPAHHGATLLDDTFSAALPSVLAALETLAALPARRRLVVLGELTDLGAQTAAGYREIGALAGRIADMLICKGDWAQTVVQVARQARLDGSALQAAVVHTAAAALHALPADLGEGDLLLVKGGATSRMERVSAGLLAPGQAAAGLLVRQEPGWSTVQVRAPGRPTWIRIDLDGLAHNVRRLRAIAGVPLMAVLKADAYGHGAVRVARTALASGAEHLAVATLGEARTLREADITAPILVLGYTPPWQAQEAVALGVACMLFDLDSAHALAAAAEAAQRRASVHVKVDTGMGRLGLAPEDVGPFLRALANRPGIFVEGLATHFATADSADERFAWLQLDRFGRLLSELTSAGLRPPIIHAANSAALLRFPTARFDMVRPGIACYGLNPGPETPLPADFRPVLTFHSEVAQVKEVPAGTPLSYGGTFVTPHRARIATIPVGYADGLRRSPPWRAVLVGGQRAPIVGRICMDYALLDVSAVPTVKRGDHVVLIGSQADEHIGADEVAEWLGTINYEVVSTLLPRVPREVGP